MQTDFDVIVFGKLPAHGDFVRHGAGREAARRLDDWLQQGLGAARERLRSQFDAAYEAAPAYHVLFSPEEGSHVLMGILQPSRDRSGRAHPLLVGLEVDRRPLDAEHATYLPVQFGRFFETAQPLVRAAATGHLDLDALVRRLESAHRSAGRRALLHYEEHLRQTTLEAFRERLWERRTDAERTDAERLSQLFENLAGVLLPLRGSAEGPRFGLRFPLRPERTAYDVSFWLDVYRRLRGDETGIPTGDPAGVPTLFWTVPEKRTGASCFLLTFAHPPPAHLFVHLLPVAFESDRIWTPGQMDGDPATCAMGLQSARYGHLLTSDRLSLWDLLHELS